MQPVGLEPAVGLTRSLTSTLTKLLGWFFVGLGILLLLIALGAGLVALDVGGSAEWFAEHSTECGPTGGSSFETCSDTGVNPDVDEVTGVMWFLFGLFLIMGGSFVAAGWATFWFGRRSQRWTNGLLAGAGVPHATTAPPEPSRPPDPPRPQGPIIS